ncbi:MAG: chromate transporter [Ruminococcaceae bacterium]|nr:chromate transporter [Oscillospiraceae bacterium]
MLYLQLFLEFFKTGLFAVGGGLATLPFLREMAASSGWFTESLLADMIAVSESTPGPIGVNMATYAGYLAGGLPGAAIATLGLITPAIVVMLLVATVLDRFKDNRYVGAVFYGLRPAVAGLIAAAGLTVALTSLVHLPYTGKLLELLDIKSILIFLVSFILFQKFKKHPIIYLAGAAVIGIATGFFGL